MKIFFPVPFVVFLAASAALAACGGGTGAAPSPSATGCGPPPPVPAPFLALSYPQPNATGVPTTIGVAVFVGQTSDYFGPTNVTLATSTGTNVPVGAYTAAPSPIPTPYAVPSNFASPIPFVAVSVPALASATTYDVTFDWPDFGGAPPACRVLNKTALGSFTTR